jgi:hypothetical protein
MEAKGNYFGIIDVIHLDVRQHSVDMEKLTNGLSVLGYKGTPFINEFSFCPHIICAMNDEGELFVDNTNSGHFSSLSRQNHIIECSSVEEFLEKVASLTGNKKIKTSTLTNDGALF